MQTNTVAAPDPNNTDLFERLQAGGRIAGNHPQWPEVFARVNQTLQLLVQLNAAGNTDTVRDMLGSVTGVPIDESTTVFPPLHTNYGRFIRLGKRVFINHDCTLLDLGGITIEDDVLIGPKVSLISENHPLDPADRKSLVVHRVLIKRNAWIGAGAIILPGVTVGENAVVAAGAVVHKDVPPNTVVGGVPARVLKQLDAGGAQHPVG